MSAKKAIIIGAGPAGLTAAYELLTRTKIQPIVIERSQYMGGISRTVNYKGNRMDIGGHRFFSKSDRVMDWWLRFLPVQATAAGQQKITYQRQSREVVVASDGPDPNQVDRVMLVRQRKSRIYFLRKFFEYPIRLTKDTLVKLGIVRTMRIGFSYLHAVAFPIRNEKNLEEFFINRFGRELYQTFFKSYTEKVWGVPCQEISAEWGAQRIKGLSIWKTLVHFVKKLSGRNSGIRQKTTETSLIEQFLYPKYGPGQVWEEVARQVKALGGEILTGYEVTGLEHESGRISKVEARHAETGEVRTFAGDLFFSTMAIKDLVRALKPAPPAVIREISEGLIYRDFITVGLLCRELKVKSDHPDANGLIKDNWIYIQEPDVKVGRLQIFNNWSPYMVADPSNVWLGLEYFCFEGDELWRKSDEDLIRLGTEELERIAILERANVLDGTVLRMQKTYPAYFGTYNRFPELREYVDSFDNLYLVGRNGMHKYNNQDHSMLAAMVAVDNLAANIPGKDNIWAVNTEQEYHEEKQGSQTPDRVEPVAVLRSE
ncbi:MAG TPA: NAD(P)/FAD-dependent oxidoreductase [Terriglobales bacterium]|nr:NAD(P)/FAD-dependent oxidoreductase [Terriglobales bacterium]